MKREELMQKNTVNTDALEQMQTTIEGTAILIDALICSIEYENTPANIDSVRCIISDQLDSVADDLRAIVEAASGKTLIITEKTKRKDPH